MEVLHRMSFLLYLKTDLPKTRHGCSICMIIVCLYSMRRHTVALSHKSDELEALQHFIAKVVDGQGFRTRRIRVDISGEQTSNLMVDYLASKGIEKHAPLRRNVTIEEVGNVSAFLCSDLASGVTGEITYVDGGMNITAAGIVD